MQKSHQQTFHYAALCRDRLMNPKVDDHETCSQEMWERTSDKGQGTEGPIDVDLCSLNFIDYWHHSGHSAQTGRLAATVFLLYTILNKSGPLIAEQVRAM